MTFKYGNFGFRAPYTGPKKRAEPQLLYEDWEPKLFDRIKIAALKLGMCRWPYGNTPVVYCGLPIHKHTSYCEGHYKRAFVLPKEDQKK